jgi:hypothetical protein
VRLLSRRAGRAAAPHAGGHGDFGRDLLSEHYKAEHAPVAP